MSTQHKKIHIIGIEGAGTSALARMYNKLGHAVSGSDEGDHFYYDLLKDEGMEVSHEFSAGNIPKNADLIVYSSAFKPETNEELKAALESNKKVLTYAEALGSLMNEKYGIAVCGSHGKTTTTAWLAFVMERSGLSPSAIIGAKVPQLGGSSLAGYSDYFVIEADEYQNKFKFYNPKAVLLNNIDYDHPDFFPTPEDYEKAFIEFIKRIPTKGFLIANYDDPIIRKTAYVNCRGRVITYGITAAADYVAYDIRRNEGGKQYFRVKLGSDGLAADEEEDAAPGELGEFSIKLSGRHNILNALAVIAASIELNIDLVKIRTYLEEFAGTNRRMEIMGKFRGAVIIDDYAHHPAEIRATLAGAREVYRNKRLIVVFHPHTFTRTKALLDDFAGSFGAADEVVILDIFGSAREKQGGVHSLDLVKKIRSSPAKHIPTLEECEKYLRENIGAGDAVILMGAGDVYKIGEKLINS
ncbi:UDP-N-acetylmuramate--L-alanine ligase [Candidatus Falkowbacteria bacterium RIFOXYB2_FULL_47_14]|uniref:UDP-N-acetylmuramate--L-alanine ligase n=1 Tax=Candidatus Falkowbacteria bacterium RIFOXYA2_FULL_47_19 TaxID=1797994 RepID=A0A1F5SMG5_9BACT|nr:MAG: UDP-N-acetylmuramate--L-alanine ligase [Candidatus Falkowbacteria bacterium RIFOXYA2_FULL_47_19]OGF35999.1 MAG: UDP-N-acetylmuramate--L-alanine ligase [Candidatus Falkowbacteria bacterium RIFOXYC2_FULL_46_15]OGF42751.1 MAG: UDP-N-acetylmuramate--L-alanine ligase [Candidatus Falkowbacteria bacterium RIFOXYB2_FULL_47_14]